MEYIVDSGTVKGDHTSVVKPMNHKNQRRITMKLRNFVVASAIVFLLFVFLPLRGAFAAPKVIELKFANYFPPPSAQSKACEEFNHELEKRTGGRIKVNYFPGGSLLKAPAIAKGIETGVADIGFSHIEYTPGRFPCTEVAEMPLGYPTAWVANQIMNDFVNEFKLKEWDKFQILWMHGNGPSQLITKKPVHTLDDLKGMTIRAPGRMAEVITALGATPAPTPVMETYDAIAKGVLDGAFTGGESVKNFRFGEVAKYVLDTWQVGPVYPFYVAMNKAKYNSLPPDLKSILDHLSGEYRERMALVWNAEDFAGQAFGKKVGVEYSSLTKEQSEKWEKAVQPVIENYVKSMIAAGYPEAEIRGWIKFLNARTAYLTEKQKALWIKSATGPEELRP
jgi:TRAP-type C4-dicarboxylate transport system substrate-binding protein